MKKLFLHYIPSVMTVMSKKAVHRIRKNAASPRRRKVLLLLTAGVVIASAVVAIYPAKGKSGTNDNAAVSNSKVSAETYKISLNKQVDTAGGEPRDGRDPGVQRQAGLVQAASSESGVGSRTDKPAAGVSGSNRQPTSPTDVYGDPSKTGVNAAGCYIDYGVPGQQCLPAAIGADGSVTCAEVRRKFPDGITVRGSDRFQLDLNGDKLACGAGE